MLTEDYVNEIMIDVRREAKRPDHLYEAVRGILENVDDVNVANTFVRRVLGNNDFTAEGLASFEIAIALKTLFTNKSEH